MLHKLTGRKKKPLKPRGSTQAAPLRAAHARPYVGNWAHAATCAVPRVPLTSHFNPYLMGSESRVTECDPPVRMSSIRTDAPRAATLRRLPPPSHASGPAPWSSVGGVPPSTARSRSWRRPLPLTGRGRCGVIVRPMLHAVSRPVSSGGPAAGANGRGGTARQRLRQAGAIQQAPARPGQAAAPGGGTNSALGLPIVAAAAELADAGSRLALLQHRLHHPVAFIGGGTYAAPFGAVRGECKRYVYVFTCLFDRRAVAAGCSSCWRGSCCVHPVMYYVDARTSPSCRGVGQEHEPHPN